MVYVPNWYIRWSDTGSGSGVPSLYCCKWLNRLDGDPHALIIMYFSYQRAERKRYFFLAVWYFRWEFIRWSVTYMSTPSRLAWQLHSHLSSSICAHHNSEAGRQRVGDAGKGKECRGFGRTGKLACPFCFPNVGSQGDYVGAESLCSEQRYVARTDR